MASAAKHSLTIAGHRTSLSLEPEFWKTLQRAARARAKPVAELVAIIDGGRQGRNLSSAIRVWLLDEVARDPSLRR